MKRCFVVAYFLDMLVLAVAVFPYYAFRDSPGMDCLLGALFFIFVVCWAFRQGCEIRQTRTFSEGKKIG